MPMCQRELIRGQPPMASRLSAHFDRVTGSDSGDDTHRAANFADWRNLRQTTSLAFLGCNILRNFRGTFGR